MGSAEYVVGPPESGAGEVQVRARARLARRAPRDRKRRSPPHVTAPPPPAPALWAAMQGLQCKGCNARAAAGLLRGCCGAAAGLLRGCCAGFRKGACYGCAAARGVGLYEGGKVRGREGTREGRYEGGKVRGRRPSS